MTIGICLSGGGARGIAHLGLLQALHENNITPEIISGVSMGAIIGAFIASGYSPKEIFDIIEHEKIYKVLRFNIGKSGLLKHSFLEKILKKYIEQDSFESLKTPLLVSATNLNTGVNEIFSTGLLIEKIIASSTVPIVFSPKIINQKWYVDGGVTNDLPTECIIKKCDFLIGSHVNFIGTGTTFESMWEIGERCFHLAVYNTVRQNKKFCDFVFEPQATVKYGMFDFNKYQEIYQLGYDYGIQNISLLQQEIEKTKQSNRPYSMKNLLKKIINS